MGWVHALARSLVSDPSAADDLAQETWLRAQGSPPAHPIHGKSLRAWLSVVVRSIARQSWRSEFRRTRREQVASHSEAVPSAHEIVERGSMNPTVAEAVMALVGTGPRRGAPIAAAPESGRPSPSNVVEHEPSTEHDLRAAVAPGSGEGPTHERGERAASTGSIGDRASAHLDSLAQTFLTDQPDIFGLMGALRSMKEK